MGYNTLDSYGTEGSCGFLEESELPQTTESIYRRHYEGRSDNNGKQEEVTTKNANDYFSISQV